MSAAVVAPRAGAGTGGPLTGTLLLARTLLRRDRIGLAVWLLAGWAVAAARAGGTYEVLYPTAAARQDRYDQVMTDVPMYLLFQGPAYGTGLDALLVQESFGAATLLAALGAVVLVVRYTRTDEQEGRRELVGATAVGRHAPLAAALAVVGAGGVLMGALTAATMAASGMPAAGSVLFGAVVAGAVGVAAAMAAVAAQVSASPRAAASGAFALFVALHFVRGVSDLGGPGLGWLGWLTPNGWMQRTRPFAGDLWWPLLLVAALAAVLVWAAFTLSDRRDPGSGLLAARPGRARAPRTLSGPVGLAWRLHRSSLAAWTAATAAVCLPAALAGSAAMGQYAVGERMRSWAAAGSVAPSDVLFVYIAFTTVFPISLYAVRAVLRIRSEEADGHAALLLAGPVGRVRWAAGHLAVALAAPVVLLTVVGLCFGAGAADAGALLATVLRLVPAVWVIVGVAAAACGLAGRAAPAVAYGALAVALTVEFGQHLGWPEWLFLALSPFAHVLPFLGTPGAPVLAALAALGLGLCAVGLFGLGRRDLGA
ncbi:antibiotic ABC transporter [Nocardiopsis sp. RSe5-2]|uniref:Antibiotic ABC transporter n=1 Tax=Nocardiopsis endophytica TaxID=3018445 RepID=A0ABT4U470_9ACTN|nr:antibiotic ABC transporter [Nocardiopsis endophytica]MDA2811751.1 antibiotic ABC transporter [Nocardiopsis endophytica]